MDSLLPFLHDRQGLAAVTRLTWQTPLPAEPVFGLFLITLGGGGSEGCTLQPACIVIGQSKRVGFLLPCRSYRLTRVVRLSRKNCYYYSATPPNLFLEKGFTLHPRIASNLWQSSCLSLTVLALQVSGTILV